MMEYKLLNNLNLTKNHSKRLIELFESSDNVILVSPFLMSDFADFFGEFDFSKLASIHLITTLQPNSFDQIKKISSLTSIIDFPNIKDKSVKCKISLNNKLHGKVYIFKKDGHFISAIISSANFTDSGLSRNHEWGVEIFDSEEIKSLEKSILETIEFSNLTFEEIYRLQEATNNFLLKQPKSEVRDIDLDLSSLLTSGSWNDRLDTAINFWLKPIGVSYEPVPEDRLFNKINDDLHFSKQRPTGVKPNDILIAFGVGTTKLLSIYKATSYPIQVTEDDKLEDDWLERWPWYVEAYNLTPKFGSLWSKYDLYKNALVDKYLELYPDKSITSAGGKTLGALNYGKDKVKLAPDFAKFIIDQVVKINGD